MKNKIAPTNVTELNKYLEYHGYEGKISEFNLNTTSETGSSLLGLKGADACTIQITLSCTLKEDQ